MFKTLIASTFLAASMAVPVLAAETGTTGTNTSGTAMTAAATTASGETSMYGRNVAASNITGATVTDPTNASIGKVDDLILNGQGQVTNYVVDVGGFLGIGSKRVALTPQDVTFTADANGNLQAKTMLTKEALTARPDYTKPEVPVSNTNASGATGTTTAPAAKP